MNEAVGIAYKVHLTGKPSSRPALILLHGAGGSHLSWPSEIRRLPGFSVYSLDLPEHGRSTLNSPTSQPASIAAYAAAIDRWLGALQLDQVVVIGHSLGSAIAMQLALDRPDLVRGLALIGSSAAFRINPILIEGTQGPDRFAATVATIIAWSFSQAASPNLKYLAAKRMLECPPTVLHNDFLACQNFDLSDHLANIHPPTLILCGTEDKMTPPRLAQTLVENIPNVSLELVPSAGHMLMLEQPAKTASLLHQFLEHLPL